MSAVLYIHGKGGSAAESERYKPLFPDSTVVGLDYKATTPWEAGREIRAAAEALHAAHGSVTLLANSIGAFFSMSAGVDALIGRAFFISPIVDMERLIRGMMAQAHVSEAELEARGEIATAGGEMLSWEYLCYVRSHPVRWQVPTAILCGANDALTPLAVMRDFAARHGASLTIMEDGEHWFHTAAQLRFVDDWLRRHTA